MADPTGHYSQEQIQTMFGVTSWEHVLGLFEEGGLYEGKWGFLAMLRNAVDGDVATFSNEAGYQESYTFERDGHGTLKGSKWGILRTELPSTLSNLVNGPATLYRLIRPGVTPIGPTRCGCVFQARHDEMRTYPKASFEEMMLVIGTTTLDFTLAPFAFTPGAGLRNTLKKGLSKTDAATIALSVGYNGIELSLNLSRENLGRSTLDILSALPGPASATLGIGLDLYDFASLGEESP
jgi:hypothetical protein